MSVIESSAFQRAFVAMSYVAGRRNAELLADFKAHHDDAKLLVQRLDHPGRERRAETLARELAALVVALEARTIT